MNHHGTIDLETERLILRRFQHDDAEKMYVNWTSDPEVACYMRWEPHQTLEDTREVLSVWVDRYQREDFYQWILVLKDSGEPMGAMGLFCVNENDECYDVAYCIGKAFWNKGYVSEALTAVLAFAFDVVGVNRVEAYHSVNNPASGKVMQKCGMLYEGRARQKYKSCMGYEDSSLYAILREDYVKFK